MATLHAQQPGRVHCIFLKVQFNGIHASWTHDSATRRLSQPRTRMASDNPSWQPSWEVSQCGHCLVADLKGLLLQGRWAGLLRLDVHLPQLRGSAPPMAPAEQALGCLRINIRQAHCHFPFTQSRVPTSAVTFQTRGFTHVILKPAQGFVWVGSAERCKRCEQSIYLDDVVAIHRVSHQPRAEGVLHQAHRSECLQFESQIGAEVSRRCMEVSSCRERPATHACSLATRSVQMLCRCLAMECECTCTEIQKSFVEIQVGCAHPGDGSANNVDAQQPSIGSACRDDFQSSAVWQRHAACYTGQKISTKQAAVLARVSGVAAHPKERTSHVPAVHIDGVAAAG